jgi:hypothetical protein
MLNVWDGKLWGSRLDQELSTGFGVLKVTKNRGGGDYINPCTGRGYWSLILALLTGPLHDLMWGTWAGNGTVRSRTLNMPQSFVIVQFVSWRMASSGMLGRVSPVRTDVSEELSASFIRVTGIGELGTTLAETSNRRTLALFLVHRFLSPSWRRHWVPPKRRFLQEPQDLTSQKTP